jgi:hypothetical protein
LNASLTIDVIALLRISLHKQIVENHAVMWQYRVTNNSFRLPSAVNVPLAIDVIRLPNRYLHKQCVKDYAVM